MREQLTINEAAKKYGITQDTARYRMRKGIPLDKPIKAGNFIKKNEDGTRTCRVCDVKYPQLRLPRCPKCQYQFLKAAKIQRELREQGL